MEGGEDEGVDGVAGSWGCGAGDWLERPPWGGWGGCGGWGAWVGSAGADPCFEEGDFCVREFFLGRHLVVVVGPADHADEETVVGFTGDDGWAGVAALFPAGAGVEGEAALHFA